MCGIAGIWGKSSSEQDHILRECLVRMTNCLARRGPDDSGQWTAAALGIGLGQRRLSILDLSPAGHQPMMSAGGRYVIVYNGEIYNCSDLKGALQSEGALPTLHGHSDTEILLASIEHWGIHATLRKLNGMFAFALWDQGERRLHLARDRFGEKPLYYGRCGSTFLFASELKALVAHPEFQGEIDRAALAGYFRKGYIGSPDSIYRGIHKLPPATLLTLSSNDDANAVPVPYWMLNEEIEYGRQHRFQGTAEEALEGLDRLLRQAVAMRMVSDVPLGAFLSGGIDSSLIVSLMQHLGSSPVRTFSIGFTDRQYDEASDARAIARHLGTDHEELYVSPAQALEVVPLLAQIYDEPFADSSQIPTFLVARLARHRVTVSLSGDAGDEIFGGYNRYIWGARAGRLLDRVPQPVRAVMAHLIRSRSPRQWDAICEKLRPVLPSAGLRAPGEKLHRLASVLPASHARSMYELLMMHWAEPDVVLHEPARRQEVRDEWYQEDFVAAAMAQDTLTYLPDDILAKVDRATMWCSLEGRIPFLDPQLVTFAWTLPPQMKVRGEEGKWLLRQLLYRYLPQEYVDRPKRGFSIPLAQWLRRELRDWAEHLLDERRLRQEGLLNPLVIRKKWTEHLQGVRNWHQEIWDVLMFQSWYDHATCPAEIQTSEPDRYCVS